jgi:dehydrogenase/reductase SDR family protein 12
MNAFGQFASTSQFYLYGRSHCTASGWEKHKAEYESPDILEESMDLSERVFMVTGANSGVGKEVTRFLASKGGVVYMVCRSASRAEVARKEIAETTGNPHIYVLLGDVGLEGEVRRVWQEFVQHREASDKCLRLDALVCNAGVLLNERTLTADNIEVTFATHLLCGTYLLGCLAMPLLELTPDSRLVAVSSGGMYNTAFPDWATATSTGEAQYSGNLAYAYAKRGQVLLMEKFATEHPTVRCMSCHPGWTDTPAVEEAYGSAKKWLEPLRTPWQGSEGIAWLCVAPASQLESGAFYLDRKPQVKHMAGPFFTEGSFTKNSPSQIEDMIRQLGELSHEVLLPSSTTLTTQPRASQGLLEAMREPIELQRFMGRWYVIANIPTFADRGTINNTEDYTWDSARGLVQISFGYSKPGQKKRSELLQRATIANESNTQWSLSPKFVFYLPVGIPYLVIHCAEDYSTTMIGVPDRKYLWIMARTSHIDDATYKEMIERASQLGFDTKQVVKVPQEWEEGHDQGA